MAKKQYWKFNRNCSKEEIMAFLLINSDQWFNSYIIYKDNSEEIIHVVLWEINLHLETQINQCKKWHQKPNFLLPTKPYIAELLGLIIG
jgi:hypothetical protein